MADARRQFGDALAAQSAAVAQLAAHHFQRCQAALAGKADADFATVKLDLFRALFVALREEVDCLFARHERRLAERGPAFRRPPRQPLLDLLQRSQHLLLARNRRLPVSLCFSGLHGEEKDKWVRLSLKLGASVSERLYQFSTTHLVCAGPPAADRRAAAARQWGIAVVDLRWLAACVEAGGFLPIDVDGQQGPAGGGGQPGETESPAGKVAPSVVNGAPGSDGGCGAGAAAALGLAEVLAAFLGQGAGPGDPSPEARGSPTGLSWESQNGLTVRTASAPLRAGPKPKRIRRADLAGDGAPPAKQPRLQPSLMTAENVAGPDSAPLPAPPLLRPQDEDGAGRTQAGQESQVLVWDHAEGADLARLQGQLRQKVFMLGGIKRPEKDDLMAKVAALGGRVENSAHYLPQATHLLVPNSSSERTEKYLSFVAAGKWILSPAYVDESHRRGCWLAEEDYRLFPAGSRIHELQSAADRAFSSWGVLLLVSPPIRRGLEVILRAGGCRRVYDRLAAADLPHVTHVFSDDRHAVTLPELPPQITAQQVRALPGYSIEYIYQYLCHTGDPARLAPHRLPCVAPPPT